MSSPQLDHDLEKAAPFARSERTANPAPLGYGAFAISTFIMGWLFLADANKHPEIIVAPSLFYGGLIQLLAGMMEFRNGDDTFNATFFTTYGGFFLAQGFIFLPSSGITAAFNGDTVTFDHLMAFYSLGWSLFTNILTTIAARRNIATLLLMIALGGIFSSSMLSGFTGSKALQMGSGLWSVITGLIGFYLTAANLYTKENAPFTLPLGLRKKK